MDRISLSDAAVTAELLRSIRKELEGDGDKQYGLYYLIAHVIPNWDAYLVMKGKIEALEYVLNQYQHIVNSHGVGLEEKVVFSRSGLN